MTGALVILAALVVIGGLLFITDKKYYRHHHHGNREAKPDESSEPATVPEEGEICCGQHLVCEKRDLQIVSDEVIYYDDEELDRFAGREPESYTMAETEEFRDVMETLLPEDVAGWAKSITLRKIELPSEVKDELLLLLSES